MKTMRKLIIAFFIMGAIAPPLMAQRSLKGMTFNGATGLYTVPSGRIGWERTANFGLDVGYHALFNKSCYNMAGDKEAPAHLFQFGISLFKCVEISGVFDAQPAGSNDAKNSDAILGFKLQLPTTAVAVALGGNLQTLNIGNKVAGRNVARIYTSVTYPASFFKMPSETTLSIGKTFPIGDENKSYNKSDIDIGMGFDLTIFPVQTQNIIHVLIDFSNFSYSDDPWGVNSEQRGVVNAGFRFDLAAIPALNKYKFVIDAYMVDLFDANRTFSLGLTLGMPIF
jgi:hypothetical protein